MPNRIACADDDGLGPACAQVEVDAVGQCRSGHHEDDQQHQQHIDQWGDVDRGKKTPPGGGVETTW
jgi:hypothetical protein